MRIFFAFLFSLLICAPAFGADYMIGNGDVLEISVWGVPEMSRSVVVRPDGKITLPAIGDIVANQQTPVKLGEILTEKMKEYIKKPIVTVSVEKIINNRVYITGGGISRVFDMVKNTTLLKLLSELGDISGTDLRSAYLYRGGKKIMTDFFSLYFEGDMTRDLELKAEDILFIPSNNKNLIYVLGAVKNPQILRHTEGMKILDAILGSGGFTEFAKENTIYVIDKNKNKRKIDLKQVTRGKDVSENILLNPGDYVIVEESIF